MIYAKWKILFDPQTDEGTDPGAVVTQRGDSITGVVMTQPNAPKNWIYGYLNDDFDFSGLDDWQITQVTREEMLEAAQQENPNCYLDENGRIAATGPSN